ncbi:MAG: hypothetical protein OIN87_13405 [Candidatus Methanoperedens sp.]|nr:hypothetical protein [Candidatus Methanoperedens sp.]
MSIVSAFAGCKGCVGYAALLSDDERKVEEDSAGLRDFKSSKKITRK